MRSSVFRYKNDFLSAERLILYCFASQVVQSSAELLCILIGAWESEAFQATNHWLGKGKGTVKNVSTASTHMNCAL